MKKHLLLLILAFAAFNARGQQTGYFNNPVIRGDVADPSIIRIGDTYYAAGTSSEWAPHYPVFKSDDLVNWIQTGHVFNEKPEWTVSSFWAPELFYHNGRVYCYYTARDKETNISWIGVASSNSPEEEFTDHGLLIEFGSEAIDAFVYDDDGQLYISWKAYGLDERNIEILGSKLSSDGLRLEGDWFTMLVDDEDILMEGQYHFKHGDYYYIIYAAHGCCGPDSDYDVYVARATSFEGPYEKYGGNPILHGGEGDYLSVGHGTAVTTPDDRMFYMCHAYMQGDWFFMGRQPILQEMVMTDDGWVQFKTGSLALARQPLPFEGTKQRPAKDFIDWFDEEKPDVAWSWNYPFSDPIIGVGNNRLSLAGNMKPHALYGTALCLRPETPNYEYSTRVLNSNESFKGLTMYGDDGNFVAWGVENGELTLKIVKRGEQTVSRHGKAPATPYLMIKVEHGRIFSFYGSEDGNNWKVVENAQLDGSANVRWDRITRPGLIHIGEPDAPAEFSYFKLENIR